jgi:hypothetical protein
MVTQPCIQSLTLYNTKIIIIRQITRDKAVVAPGGLPYSEPHFFVGASIIRVHTLLSLTKANRPANYNTGDNPRRLLPAVHFICTCTLTPHGGFKAMRSRV